MWQAIKWGFGLLIGALLAYALFWVFMFLGVIALVTA